MPALDGLVPEFRAKVDQLLINCRNRNIEMRPEQGLRLPREQGRLWRQSRTRKRVLQEISRLKDSGALFLAFCIEDVGPQDGPHVTNAIPGYSLHQWGEALDCVWIVNGAREFSVSKKVNGKNGYRVYAEEAANLGLTAGGFWPDFPDWAHVQLHPGTPDSKFTLLEIDAEMRRRFG